VPLCAAGFPRLAVIWACHTSASARTSCGFREEPQRCGSGAGYANHQSRITNDARLALSPSEHAAHDEQDPEDERRDEHVEALRRNLSRGHEDNHGDDRGGGPKDAED